MSYCSRPQKRRDLLAHAHAADAGIAGNEHSRVHLLTTGRDGRYNDPAGYFPKRAAANGKSVR
jgi:hypothetical protein